MILNAVTLLPPDDLIGADKLFADARLGSIIGPLKLGALRTWQIFSFASKISFSNLTISKQLAQHLQFSLPFLMIYELFS